METQDRLPLAPIELSEVGIKNLKTLLTVRREDKIFRFIPIVDVTIDLPATLKGVHLSRVVEAISLVLSDETHIHESVEEMTIHVLDRLRDRHPYTNGKITLEFDFAQSFKTPISKKRTLEVYRIILTTFRQASYDNCIHRIRVKVKGNTVCPHAMEKTGGKTHIQRAIGTLIIVGETSQIPTFEELIQVVESSFSSRTYSLLKTEDEKYVVEEMFRNPLFCEDVTRTILNSADRMFSKHQLNFYSEVISEESIHKHDIISRGKIIRYQELEQFNPW